MQPNRRVRQKRPKAIAQVPRGRSTQLSHALTDFANCAHPTNRTNDVSQEGTAKITLAFKLNELLGQQGLSQSAASQLLGMPQPKVSAIRNYKLRGISLERLMQALLALNQQVEIVVKPGRRAGTSSIQVAV